MRTCRDCGKKPPAYASTRCLDCQKIRDQAYTGTRRAYQKAYGKKYRAMRKKEKK